MGRGVSVAVMTLAERTARDAWRRLHERDGDGCRCDSCEFGLRAVRRFFAVPGERMAEVGDAIAAARERWA